MQKKYQFCELFLYAAMRPQEKFATRQNWRFYSVVIEQFFGLQKTAERTKVERKSATIEYPDKINFDPLFCLPLYIKIQSREKKLLQRKNCYRVQHNSIHIFSIQSALCLELYEIKVNIVKRAKKGREMLQKSCNKI